MKNLLNRGTLCTRIDEQIVFSQLDYSEEAIWSLLLAGGYLKVTNHVIDGDTGEEEYELKITNKEVRIMFRNMIRDWFRRCGVAYNDFVKALLADDIEAMNIETAYEIHEMEVNELLDKVTMYSKYSSQ